MTISFASMCAQSHLLPEWRIGNPQRACRIRQVYAGSAEQRGARDQRVSFRGIWLESALQRGLSSCYLGLRKPDQAIFRAALDILGRPAKRILFIDDREENTAAASLAGMKAIKFEGAEALRAAFLGLGVVE